METSPKHGSVESECQTEEHWRAINREVQRRYRQARGVSETAEEKQECLSRKKLKVLQKKEGLKLVSLLELD